MKTVPLRGQKARGRVALVDDEDYELVSQYRWYVWEKPGTATKRPQGPYVETRVAGTRSSLRMHILIMGQPGIDHRDHNGLNNQRSNLRIATGSQNNQNMRSPIGYTSQYKGVYWSRQKRRWHATIAIGRKSRHLGFYVSEVEAAIAYDDAAPEMFGEFACLNFPGGVSQELRDQLRAEREATEARDAAEARLRQRAGASEWWQQRAAETYACTVCGAAFLARSLVPALYCGETCKRRAKRRRERERRTAGRLF